MPRPDQLGAAAADRDLGRDRVRQEERHRLGEAVGADVEDGHEVAGLRAAAGPRWLAKTSSPEQSGPATVTGQARGPRPRGAEHADPMLLADEGRPEEVVDAAVEDRDLASADALAIDDAGEVRARRADQEAPGLEEEPHPAGVGSPRPSRARARRAGGRGRPGRAIPRAARRGSRARRRRRRAGARTPAAAATSPAELHRLRHVRRQDRRVEDVRRAEPWTPSRSRCGETMPRRGPPPAGRARPSRTCRRRRRRRAGRARGASASVTAARSRTGGRAPGARRRSPRGGPARRAISTVTARTPASTAAASSVVALAGPGHDDPLGRRCPARSAVASSPPEATSAPRPERAEVGHDRERRVGLDRVGDVDARRAATRRRAATWRSTTSRS